MATRHVAPRARETRVGLALHPATLRVDELLKERERLLRNVSKKKEQLEQTRAVADRDFDSAFVQIAPLAERHAELVRELTALFDELLIEGHLSARARNQVRKVRSSLERQGLLSPIANEAESPESTDAWDDDAPPPRRPDPKANDHSTREVPSASQPGRERRTLRDIFRSLARAVHPDQAQQEPDRQRRTEVMKEVTRAYEEGDVARLIELERTWQSERVVAGGGDPEARCAELERINRELLNQVQKLTRELRDLRREVREQSLGPIEHVVEEANRELEDLAALSEFVRKFRDGKITLAEFTRGPSPVRDIEDEELVLIIEDFLTAELSFDSRPAPKSRRGKRRR